MRDPKSHENGSEVATLLERAAAEKQGGQLKEALQNLQKALLLAPQEARVFPPLASLLQEMGHPDTALRVLRQGTTAAPHDADLWAILGSALRAAGQPAEARAALRKAALLAPKSPQIRMNLGNALVAAGETAAGLRSLRRACRLAPELPLPLYNLALALQEVDERGEARERLEQALSLKGLEAEVRVNLARLDEIEGHREAAVEQWRLAARAAPHLARPQFALARSGRLEDASGLESMVEDARTPQAQRLEAHFGLAYHHERAGRYEEAFRHFRAGNELKRASLPPYDPDRHSRLVDRIVETFDAEYFESLQPALASEAPLFIVGMPRSGTTLLESILAAHPAVDARGERKDIPILARRWSKPPFSYPETVPRVPTRELLSTAESYLRDVPAAALRTTDKLPANFLHLGLIASLFGGARVVHCRRDPLDTCVSAWCQLFEGTNLPFSYDLEYLARYYRDYERLMEHWKSVLPLPLHDVDYEKLVLDVESASRELLRFAGLEFDPRCLERDSAQPVFTASVWRVRDPVDSRSVGRARRYAEHLGPLLSLADAPRVA